MSLFENQGTIHISNVSTVRVTLLSFYTPSHPEVIACLFVNFRQLDQQNIDQHKSQAVQIKY